MVKRILFLVLLPGLAWGQKISDLPTLSAPASSDYILSLDVSDTTAGAGGSAKKFALSALTTYVWAGVTGTGTWDLSATTLTLGPIASLGTPGAGTLTNCTGLPISTGVSGLGTGVATFLATPSGANLASALTSALPESKGGTGVTNLTSSALATLVGDGTGTGPSVFGTSPTFTSRIDLGSNGTAAGSLFINGSTSGYANLIPASATMGNRTIQLPAADGVIALVDGGIGAATATTATAGDDDTSVATTAFVNTATRGSETGVHATPSTTNPLSPTWTSIMHVVWYGATGTINLPAASGYSGRSILIYNTGAFTVTIDPNGSEVVVRDGNVQTGGVNFTLSAGAGNYVGLISDGARWITLGYKGTLAVGS